MDLSIESTTDMTPTAEQRPAAAAWLDDHLRTHTDAQGVICTEIRHDSRLSSRFETKTDPVLGLKAGMEIAETLGMDEWMPTHMPCSGTFHSGRRNRR